MTLTEMLPSQRSIRHKRVSTDLFNTLPHDWTTIRLLVLEPTPNQDSSIRCRLNTIKLSRYPDYEAVSYSWGAPSPTRLIHVNGTPVEIRLNLHHCLLRLRHTEKSRMLWIDAICINQNDNEEKSHQIELMPRIYSSARRVVAWLGETADGSDDVLVWAVDHQEKLCNLSRAQPPTNLLEPITRLFERQYWYRTWIIQELLQAREQLFICGGCEVPGPNLLGLVIQCAHSEQRERCALLMSLSADRDERGKSGINFPELLKLSFNTHCTDDRDKIYALLGLLSLTEPLRALNANYSISTSELFCKVLSVTNTHKDHETYKFRVENLLKALNLRWSTLKLDHTFPAICRHEDWDDLTLSSPPPTLSNSTRVSMLTTKNIRADDIFITSPKTPNFHFAFRRVQESQSDQGQTCVGLIWVGYCACAGYCSDLAAIDGFFRNSQQYSEVSLTYDYLLGASEDYDTDIGPLEYYSHKNNLENWYISVPKLLSAAIQLYEDLGSRLNHQQ